MKQVLLESYLHPDNKSCIFTGQIHEVEIPEVHTGRTGEILEKMSLLLETLPEDIQIRLPDIQSPLGVAELMWDQSFYLALLTNPEEVHILLENIT